MIKTIYLPTNNPTKKTVIRIDEVLSQYIIVEHDFELHSEEILNYIKDQYNEGNIVLTADDYLDTDIDITHDLDSEI